MIGILDSGIGGLSIYLEIKKLDPDAAIVYLADQRNFPYGEKTQTEIENIVTAAVQKLIEFGANPIVIACNSATVSTIELMRSRFPQIQFVGVEPAVRVAARETQKGVVGVLATKKTVHTHDSEALEPGLTIYKHYAPGLIEKIENNLAEVTDEDITLAAEPLTQKGIDTLVLGCTHFYFVRDRFAKLFLKVTVVEPSANVASRVFTVSSGKIEAGPDIFLTTADDDKLRAFLLASLGKDSYDIRQL